MIELILGPPGTGKTTELLSIVEQELARGTRPNRIGFVSFTKRAALEGIERASIKFGLSRDDLPHFRTLHSMCFRALGLNREYVFADHYLQEWADYAGVKVSGHRSEDGTLIGYEVGDRVIFLDNLFRSRRTSLEDEYRYRSLDVGRDLLWPIVEYAHRCLNKYKASKGLVDYTDMLERFVNDDGLGRPGLEILIVDEAQDLSKLQWMVVWILARGCRRIIVAGDDDQAIYHWSGADLETFLGLDGNVRYLEQSHRVPSSIHNLALPIINYVRARRPKQWRPRAEAGGFNCIGQFTHDDCAEGEIMVLVRNSYLLHRIVIPELRHGGIVYEHQGECSVDPHHYQVIVDWERLRRGESISVEAAREVYKYLYAVAPGFRNLPGFKDGDLVTMIDLRQRGGLQTEVLWREALRLPQRNVDYYTAALKRKENLRKPRVRLSTIHSAKGAQADQIILFTEMARLTYQTMRTDWEDEARVWYVAVTRARQQLTLVHTWKHRKCPWL